MAKEARGSIGSALNSSDELHMSLIDACVYDGQCKTLEEGCTLQVWDMTGFGKSPWKVQTERRMSIGGSRSDMAIARHSTRSRKDGISVTSFRCDWQWEENSIHYI